MVVWARVMTPERGENDGGKVHFGNTSLWDELSIWSEEGKAVKITTS